MVKAIELEDEEALWLRDWLKELLTDIVGVVDEEDKSVNIAASIYYKLLPKH